MSRYRVSGWVETLVKELDVAVEAGHLMPECPVRVGGCCRGQGRSFGFESGSAEHCSQVGGGLLVGLNLEARSVNAKVVLEFLQDIRRRYPPDVQLYIVMDGLSAHWTPEIRAWAVNNHVGLLPTPTNASHLNRIECHFWAYVEFVINGSDYPDWTAFSKATQAYIRRRNRDRHDPLIRDLENRRKVAETVTGGTKGAGPLALPDWDLWPKVGSHDHAGCRSAHS